MYIAIEGIKGTGKSTVLLHVQHALESMNVPNTYLRPYSLNESNSTCDRIFRACSKFWPDWAVARFYARRSDRLAAQVPRRRGLLIGDRSIVTSYITRWSDSNPIAAMDAVDRLERRIPLPDHVVLLDAPVEVALQRIQWRPQRGHGLRDEQRGRLLEARRAYRALAAEPARFGLHFVKWHVVDAARPLHQVTQDVADLVLRLATLSTFSSPTKVLIA